MENLNTPSNISEWLNESTTKKSLRDSTELPTTDTKFESHGYATPQLLISGVTIKHGGKEGKQAVVPRYCIVRLTRVGNMIHKYH